MDERLIERIAECISGGGRDAGEISQTLREKFPEYSRRPVPALKIMVERAMSEMARRATAESGGGVGGGDGSQQRHEEGGEEEEGSDGDVKIVEHHSLNSSLVAFYKKTSPALTPPAPLQPSGTPQPATSVPAVSPVSFSLRVSDFWKLIFVILWRKKEEAETGTGCIARTWPSFQEEETADSSVEEAGRHSRCSGSGV